MDRAYNLEALHEEEDEEETWEDKSQRGYLPSSINDEERSNVGYFASSGNDEDRSVMGRFASSLNEDDDDDESSQEEGQDSSDEDEEVREPNKFDNLCDGVVSATALVQAALKELMDFKDDLLQHALPPNVLVKLALVTSRVYRSVSDLQMPSNELIRMVRVYSTPWEEKSTALKKLHQDYESKQRQLNIAIKRLQLVDAHSKRIAREKRLMNWEKLFSKLTSAKGHGRRWKFMIESIKEKAKLGLEHVHEFARALEESSDEEEQEEEETAESQLSGKQGTELLDDNETGTDAATDFSATPGGRADSDEESKEKESLVEGSETDSDRHSVSRQEEEGEGQIEDRVQSAKEPPGVIVAMTTESDNSSDYSRSGSGKRVRFEESDSLPIMEKPPMVDQTTWTEEPKYSRKLHMRIFAPEGLEQKQLNCVISLGKQMKKTGVLDIVEDIEEEEEIIEEIQPKSPISKEKTEKGDEEKKNSEKAEDSKKTPHYEEFIFDVPDNIPDGVWTAKKPVPEELQVAVNSGPTQEMVAMATIKYEDIKAMDLPTVEFPPPKGDVPKLFVDMDITEITEANKEADNESPSLQDNTPSLFPLYSLKSGKGPSGSLPLVLYWGQTLQPRSFNRQTGTSSMTELVYDLTGIDLEVTSKEDLIKETRDEASSAIAFTPEPQEETVSRTEHEEMMKKHREELVLLQEQYESRLQGLMENLQNMPSIPTPVTVNQEDEVVQRSQSAGSKGHPLRATVPVSPVSLEIKEDDNSMKQPRPPSSQKPKKNFRVGRPLPKWGDSVPSDFLSRLEKYENETTKHRQALSDKLWQEMSRDIEMKLAGQHKLSEAEKVENPEDVSLPALFMPFKSGNIFNPRAHQYFHPKGSNKVRLTQPPSVFQLPPLPQNKLAVVNLFNLSGNFQQPPSWLMERYIEQQQPTPQGAPPSTPAIHGGPTSSFVTPYPSMVEEPSGNQFETSQNYHPVSATASGEAER